MRYFSRSDPRALVPGELYEFELELYPSSYVFRAGHRIRLTLQGAAFDPLVKPAALALPAFLVSIPLSWQFPRARP